MIANPMLESTLRELLEAEWARSWPPRAGRGDARNVGPAAAPPAEGESQARSPRAGVPSCPLLPLVPDLLTLLEELHGRPIERLLPMLRQMLYEREFAAENGDSIALPSAGGHAAVVERQVAIIARVLHALRQEAFEAGEWSDAPVTPIMFG